MPDPIGPSERMAAELSITRLNREIVTLNASIKDIEARPLSYWEKRPTTEWLTLIASVVSFVFVIAHLGSAENCLYVVACIAFISIFLTLSARRTGRIKTMRRVGMEKLQSVLDAKRSQLQAQRRVIAEPSPAAVVRP